jgi:hypothetical protein
MKSKRLKISTINRKYRGQWLLLANCRLDEMNEPLDGIVVEHSKNRDKIYDSLKKYSESLCIYYAGHVPPKGVAYAL